MRITELLNESEILDEITRPAKHEAANILRNAGYKLMGEGAFATVYGKPGADHVLKLFFASDTGYMEFVKVVNSNSNIHFPRFKGKMMRVTDDYYAIRMELLTPVPDNRETEYVARTLSNYTRMIKGLAPYKQTENEVSEAIPEIEEDQPGIIDACSLIAHGTTKVIDIHNENIMMRGDVIVITDPVAW